MQSRFYTFNAGNAGHWKIDRITAIAGDLLPFAERLNILNGPPDPQAAWTLRGVTSNARYMLTTEKTELVAKQVELNRPDATCGAIIPIRKSAAWWDLPQDERRKIFEDRSSHTSTGLKYLPAIARRLHHCRDLETAEPFDFITLFDYAPAAEQAFNDLLGELRASEEWKFIEREVDIRLTR